MNRPGTRMTLFTASTASFLSLLAALAGASVLMNGRLVYTLDDAYIHMAMAKNLALHGTWGVVPGVFEPASSGPAWTLALSGLVWLAPAGMHVYPLLLNVTAGVWVLWSFSGALEQRLCGERAPRIGWHLAAAYLPVGLFLIAGAMTGMEHLLHTALMLQLLVLYQALVSGQAGSGTRAAYLALIALAVVVRFETLFFVVAGSMGLLLTRGRRAIADVLMTGFAAAVPVLVNGWINLSHGRYFMPNSVAGKTVLGSGKWLDLLLPKRLGLLLLTDPLLVGMLILTAYLLARMWRRSGWQERALPFVFLVTALIHYQYAIVFMFPRYQIYLLWFGAFVLVSRWAWLMDAPRPRWGIAMAVVLLPLLFAGNTRYTALSAVASNNIFEQQWQMGRFLGEHYRGRAVAINDLGLVALHHGGPLIDLVGLGSFEVLQARKEGRNTRAWIEQIVAQRGVAVVVVYDSWLRSGVPPSWIKVAEWTISRRLVTPADRYVSFYALDSSGAQELASRLRAYEPSLPRGAGVRYFQ